jgi:hypothetical protein
MRVISINNKASLRRESCPELLGGKSLNLPCASSKERLTELLTFSAGAALTFLAPALAYCTTVAQLWPLYLVAGNLALGTMLGLIMFKKSFAGFLSCVPVTRTPKVLSADELKEAA